MFVVSAAVCVLAGVFLAVAGIRPDLAPRVHLGLLVLIVFQLHLLILSCWSRRR